MTVPITEMTNLHYLEWLVLNDERFMGTIEATMRAVAVQIYTENPDTHGHAQRAQVALNIALSDVGKGEAARFRNIFATVVINNAALRNQFFDAATPNLSTTERIKPWLMEPLALHQAIASAWDVAANVQPGSEQEG